MSLTEVASSSRKIIKYGGIGLISFLILWPIYTIAVAAYKKAHPPYTPPTIRFGILPKIVFPDKKFEKKNFIIQTPNDALPNFSDQAKVYVIYRPTSSFLALESDTITAKNFGFMSDPTEISSGVYQFKNDNLNQTLTMNVLDGSFKLQYPYQNDQTLIAPQIVPTKEKAVEIAGQFLEAGKKMEDDLKNGTQQVSYWKIGFDGLSSVQSQSDANVARVDFFREDLDNLKILSTEKDRASVSVLVSGSSVEGKKILDLSYKYANIDRESFSTYPIKTAQQAVDDLKSGNYWPVSDISSSDVTIRNIYLAYFEPVTLTNFMEPVFVFEGNNNFTAYVPAVVDSYTK